MTEPQDTIKLPLAPEPLLLTRVEAAAMCGVSCATWDRMVSAGRAPAPVRPSPGCVRWRRSDLLTWIQYECDMPRFEAARQQTNGLAARR